MRWNWLEAQPGDHRTARKRRRMSKQERRQQRLKAEDERQRLEKSRDAPSPSRPSVFSRCWDANRPTPHLGTVARVRVMGYSPSPRLHNRCLLCPRVSSDSSWLLTGFERVPIDSSEFAAWFRPIWLSWHTGGTRNGGPKRPVGTEVSRGCAWLMHILAGRPAGRAGPRPSCLGRAAGRLSRPGSDRLTREPAGS